MNLKNLFTDDDAVSPVIGVILMVAITVILAAVIGAFVLDLGSSQESTPQISFDFDEKSGGDVLVKMQSGESISGDLLSTQIDGSGQLVSGNDWDQYTEVGAGDSVTVENTDSSTEIEIIWTAESGDTSSSLASYDVQ